MAISKIIQYTGTIPDKATQTPNDFANAVHPYLDYFNATFVPQASTMVDDLNTNATQMQILHDETATNAATATTKANEAANFAQNALQSAMDAANTVATIPEGSLNDSVIALDKTWSSSQINDAISTSGGVKFFDKNTNEYFAGYFMEEHSSYELKIVQIDTDKYVVCGSLSSDNKSFGLVVVNYDTVNDSFTFSPVHTVTSAGNVSYDGYYFDIEALDSSRVIVTYNHYIQVFTVYSDGTFTDGTALNISYDHTNYNYNIFKIGTDKVLVRNNSDVGIFNISGTDVSASGGTTVVETNSTSYNCGDMIQLDTGIFISYTSTNGNTPYLHGYTFDANDNVSVVDFTGIATGLLNSSYGKLIKTSSTGFWLTSTSTAYNHMYVMYSYTFDGTTFAKYYRPKYLLTNQIDIAGNYLQPVVTPTSTYLFCVGKTIDYSISDLSVCKLNCTNVLTDIVEYYGRKDMQQIDSQIYRQDIQFYGGTVLSNGKILRAISRYDGTDYGMYFSTLMEV